MKKNIKLFLFIILFFLIVISLLIYRYEKLLTQTREEARFDKVEGGVPVSKKYTATEIVALIQSSKEYIGDSITIFDNGQMSSSNGKLQGTINAVIRSKDNMDMVKSSMNTNKLPIQYNIYTLAAIYYRQQYPSEFTAK